MVAVWMRLRPMWPTPAGDARQLPLDGGAARRDQRLIIADRCRPRRARAAMSRRSGSTCRCHPSGDEPPHGKDPRYWLDVTKIIQVPEGTLAPCGHHPDRAGLYYPIRQSGLRSAPDPPPAAKYPLDIGDITSAGPPVRPELPPYVQHRTLAGMATHPYRAPDPNAGHQVPAPPWSAPQQPIDVRDVIHVPAGRARPVGIHPIPARMVGAGPAAHQHPDHPPTPITLAG